MKSLNQVISATISIGYHLHVTRHGIILLTLPSSVSPPGALSLQCGPDAQSSPLPSFCCSFTCLVRQTLKVSLKDVDTLNLTLLSNNSYY